MPLSSAQHDETVTLEFARPLPKGEVTLSLEWTSKLNKHLRGLYAASSGEPPKPWR